MAIGGVRQERIGVEVQCLAPLRSRNRDASVLNTISQSCMGADKLPHARVAGC